MRKVLPSTHKSALSFYTQECPFLLHTRVPFFLSFYTQPRIDIDIDIDIDIEIDSDADADKQ